MMKLALRHLRHHARLAGAVLTGLTLASAVLAGLSGYIAAVSAQELRRSLAEAGPAERTLYITGTVEAFGEELYSDVQERLGRLLEERLEIRHGTLPADPQPSSQVSARHPAVARLELYSFDKLVQKVRLVEGRLPEQVSLTQAVGNWPPPVEAVIGQQAAERAGCGIGDRLTASGLYHRLDIVGIVEPLDGGDDLWGGSLSSFETVAESDDLDAGAIALPLIIAPESMRAYLGQPIFPHEVSWRITLRTDRIGPDGAEALRSRLTGLSAQAATRGAQTNTGLLAILDDFILRLSRLRAALLLLSAQSLVLVVYALSMLCIRVVSHLEADMVGLSVRGASTWQILRLLALENLVLAVPAGLLLGPGLGHIVLCLWSYVTRETLPLVLTPKTWLLSSLAAGLGWLIWVVSVVLEAWRCSREPQPRRDRPPRQSALHRHFVDLYLLAFGGLLVWQLNRSGSFLARVVASSRLGSGPLADPLLLLGPLVLVLGAAAVLLRIVPPALRLAARLVLSGRGLALPLGLLHAAHDPLQPGGVVLLVGITAGLALFAQMQGDVLARSQSVLHPDPLVQGIGDAFLFSALMPVLFSAAIFLLVHLGQARIPGIQSEHRPGILRTVGLTARQGAMATVAKGGAAMFLGLLVGVAVGLGLCYTTTPHLSRMLLGPAADLAAQRFVVDWPVIGRLCAFLTAVYGSGLAVIGWVRGRWHMHRAPWMEDE